MNRKVIATDGQIILLSLEQSDKKYYMEMQNEINNNLMLGVSETRNEVIWMDMMSNSQNYFSIYNSEEEFCGIVGVENASEKVKSYFDSEIWVELLESRCYQGLGEKVIRLVLEHIYQGQQLEYTSVRFRMK